MWWVGYDRKGLRLSQQGKVDKRSERERQREGGGDGDKPSRKLKICFLWEDFV
jgi:hypothetical protein